MRTWGTVAIAVALVAGTVGAALWAPASVQADSKVKSFCEYGYAEALGELGANGGEWVQTWGEQPVNWFMCEADPSNGLLNASVTGQLETERDWSSLDFSVDETTGRVVLPLVGELTLSCEAGEMLLGLKGNFLIHGGQAFVEDPADTVFYVPFGFAVQDDTPTPMSLTLESATGKYKNVEAAGDWEMRVAGYVEVLRLYVEVPDGNGGTVTVPMPLLQNALMALYFPALDLVVGAEEEIVLTGEYYRAAPGKKK